MRKASASSVSRLLGEKFRRAKSSASPIRGVRNQHAGFEVVRGTNARNARVYHVCGRSQRDGRAARIQAKIKEYAEYLEPHYDVWDYTDSLLVMEKSDD